MTWLIRSPCSENFFDVFHADDWLPLTYIEIAPQESSGQVASFDMTSNHAVAVRSIKVVILLLIVAPIVYGHFVFSLLNFFRGGGGGLCLFFVCLFDLLLFLSSLCPF